MEESGSSQERIPRRYVVARLLRELAEAEMRKRLDWSHSERFGER